MVQLCRCLTAQPKLNTRINRLHEGALQIVYQDFDSFFEELLRKDSSTTLQQRNQQKLRYSKLKLDQPQN